MPTLVEQLLPSHLATLIRSQTNDQKVWLVGGALRDHFLDLKQPDLDFAVDGGALKLARSVADALSTPYFVLDEQREAARVILGDGATLDFARLRAPTLEVDLNLRDFTINALAVDLEDPERLIDPLHGLQDIKDRVLRACADDSIERDGIRALRAVRFLTSLKLRIDDQTKAQIRQASRALSDCAAERRRDELSKLLETPLIVTAARLMKRLDILPGILPEQDALGPFAWERTLNLVDKLTELMVAVVDEYDPDAPGNLPLAELSLRLGRYRTDLRNYLGSPLRGGHKVRQVLFFSAMFAEIPDAIYGRMRALRFSDAEGVQGRSILRARELAAELGDSLTDLNIHRYFRDSGRAGVEGALLQLASQFAVSLPQDQWESQVEVARKLLEARFERYQQVIEPPRLVRGDDLIAALDLSPGPIVGEILERIAEEQVVGNVDSDEQAVQFARAWLTTRVD